METAAPTVYIGIDPGFKGAIAILDTEARKLKLIDTPILINPKTKKRAFEVEAMVDILKPYQDKSAVIYLELVHAMPNQGVVSMFGFGEGFGIWKGIVCALGYPLTLSASTVWKRTYGERLFSGSAKAEARYLASELFPSAIAKLSRSGDTDRAEALLMAEHLRRQYAICS